MFRFSSHLTIIEHTLRQYDIDSAKPRVERIEEGPDDFAEILHTSIHTYLLVVADYLGEEVDEYADQLAKDNGYVSARPLPVVKPAKSRQIDRYTTLFDSYMHCRLYEVALSAKPVRA